MMSTRAISITKMIRRRQRSVTRTVRACKCRWVGIVMGTHWWRKTILPQPQQPLPPSLLGATSWPPWTALLTAIRFPFPRAVVFLVVTAADRRPR